MGTAIKKKLVVILVGTVATAIVLTAILFYFFQPKPPIKIGLSTTLTGKASTYGRGTRNGVILAVEQLNQRGGLHGRMLELLIRDDKLEPADAIRVDQELVDAGVDAILGHPYSTCAVAAVPLMNKNNMLMIGLATSSDELTGLDDNFIRLTHSLERKSVLVSSYIFNQLGIKKLSVIYDLSNPKYTQSLLMLLKEKFEKLGGELCHAEPFDPRAEFSSPFIAREIIASGAEAVYIITNAIQSAMLVQHLRINRSKIKVIDSGWGMSDPDFIINGGHAVEGCFALYDFNPDSMSPEFKEFSTAYQNWFQEEVSMGAQRGYEAAQVLFFALSKTEQPDKLKDIILAQKIFRGLDNQIILDEYGDSDRIMYILTIKDNRLRTIGKIDPGKITPILF